MKRGYLTLAAGSPRFLEMAVDMALSLRRHTDLPVAVAADEPLAELARKSYGPVFDHVALIPERFLEGRARKYGCAAASPFERTVFIDADCLVLGVMDDIFDFCEDADVAMTGEQLTESQEMNHHGFSTTALIRRFRLPRYLKTNSGLFYFRNPAAVEIMEECRECHENEVLRELRWSRLLGRWLGDEIAFGIVGGRRGFHTLPKPDWMLWPNEIRRLDLADPEKPLLHMIWPPARETLDRLLREATARRRAAGVPGTTEEHWHTEVQRLKRMAFRRRVLAPLSRG